MNRTERLYAIVQELRLAAPRGRTAAWLAERFEVSERTIKRDMRALHDSDVGLVADEGRGGGYSLDRDRMLPPMAFSPAEATAIAVAIGASDDLPFRDQARTALAKILDAMSPSQRAEASDVARRLWVRDGNGRGRWAGVLDDALRERRVVNVDYADADGRVTHDRPIEPLAFARTRRHWHVLAWCRLREGGRWFRMDRIQAAHLTREVAPIRDLAETFGPPPEDARPIEL
ncbi:MAG: WYL domain-containing protein [Alphaproteobacteria bacterium]|nr:WYL domain-containing protein [Alphaproteobacteria bacterium]